MTQAPRSWSLLASMCLYSNKNQDFIQAKNYAVIKIFFTWPRMPFKCGTLRVKENGWHKSFVSFWQCFPHYGDCFLHSFSSQKFEKLSLWNKYHFQTCDLWKFVGKTHHSCKFLGHSRPNGLSWPKNLHSRWVFSLLISRSRSKREWKMTIFSWIFR